MTDARPLEKPDGFSLALNTLPFLHAASGLAVAFVFAASAAGRLAWLAAWIYLLPPLAGRLAIACFGVPGGQLTQDMRGYRVWWLLTQLQTIFNRLPWLEEVLRLVPGLYAGWIALWGGRVSPFAYIGPGVIIADRYLVNVGRGAVLGFKSALASHMVVRDDAGRYVVVVAPATVEPEAILGGDAAIGPGATLRAGHMLPAGRKLGPFDEWPRSGRELRDAA